MQKPQDHSPDVRIARYVLDQIFFNLVSSAVMTDAVRMALNAAIGVGGSRNHPQTLTIPMADLVLEVRHKAPVPLRAVARAVRDYVTEREGANLHELAGRQQ